MNQLEEGQVCLLREQRSATFYSCGTISLYFPTMRFWVWLPRWGALSFFDSISILVYLGTQLSSQERKGMREFSGHLRLKERRTRYSEASGQLAFLLCFSLATWPSLPVAITTHTLASPSLCAFVLCPGSFPKSCSLDSLVDSCFHQTVWSHFLSVGWFKLVYLES